MSEVLSGSGMLVLHKPGSKGPCRYTEGKTACWILAFSPQAASHALAGSLFLLFLRDPCPVLPLVQGGSGLFVHRGKMAADSHLCGFSDQVTPSSPSLGIGSKGQPKATKLQCSVTS